MKLSLIDEICKGAGLVLLLGSVILGFADLRGWLKDKDKEEVLNWILQLQTGLSIDRPGAQKFLIEFPPPDLSRNPEISHLTKKVVRSVSGPPLNASINYMYTDLSRSDYVATLEDVRTWASRTGYPFWIWLLSAIAFALTAAGYIIERMQLGRTNAWSQPSSADAPEGGSR